MTEQEYNEEKGIRSTQIKAFATGGELALWQTTFGEKTDSPAMRIGRLCHAVALLPEEEWSKMFVVAPYDDFRTKEAREWKATQIANGIDICTSAEIELAKKVADCYNRVAKECGGVCAHPVEPFANTEIPSLRTYEGTPIKARADHLSADGKLLIDFKTTSNVTDAENQFWRMRYDLQAGHYSNAFEDVEAVAFIFVETSAPFRNAVVMLVGDALDEAKELALKYALKADTLLRVNGDHPDRYNSCVACITTTRPAWLVEKYL